MFTTFCILTALLSVGVQCWEKVDNFNSTILQRVVEEYTEESGPKNVSRIIDVTKQDEEYRIILEMALLSCKDENLDGNCTVNGVGICYFEIKLETSSSKIDSKFKFCPGFENADAITPLDSWKPLSSQDSFARSLSDVSFTDIYIEHDISVSYTGTFFSILEYFSLEISVRLGGSIIDRNIHENPRLITAECESVSKVKVWEWYSDRKENQYCTYEADVLIEEKELDPLSSKAQGVADRAWKIYKKDAMDDKFTVVKATMSAVNYLYTYGIDLEVKCPTGSRSKTKKCSLKITIDQMTDMASLKDGQCSSCDS